MARKTYVIRVETPGLSDLHTVYDWYTTDGTLVLVGGDGRRSYAYAAGRWYRVARVEEQAQDPDWLRGGEGQGGRVEE